MNYALALCHLGDRCVGGQPFVQKFPGSERGPTLAEIEEIQRRLSALGYDIGEADGRIGNDHDCLRCGAISAKSAWSRPTAMRAWDFSPGCAKGS